MTQGKLSVANKAPGTEGQQQANGEKKETPAVPSAPPSYEEATSGEGLKAGAFPPAPSAMPLHPSWAYVDPSNSSSYESGFPTGDHEFFTTFSWDDQKVRRVFIRKVYTILLIQLLVTLGVVALFTFCDPVKDYVQANPVFHSVLPTPPLSSELGGLPYRRHFPWNLILLTIFVTPARGSCSYYNTTSVLLCLSITALVCLSVTVFSFQTKFDFTSCQGVLFVLLMTLFFSGLILAILLPFQYVPWLHAVYAVLGAGVFTLFLAFDTQLLMGSRRHSLSPEEYIFGALNIYLDIIYIFTFFLQLFGTNRE
uniref:Protein lifeguard 2 n=1 Tax=Capra hircus TaxID=9925 RepID=A0A452F8B9_CAPHI